MDAQLEKDEKKIIKISVRNLVEFILREGDIDNRHGRTASPEAMWEGSRIHKRIQKSKGANYHAEVPLKIELSEGDYTLAIEGRADGIEITCDGERQPDFSDNFNYLAVEEGMHVTIDEIKGIYMNLDALDEPVGVHRAQAMCYAYIYALQHDLAEISVQLTYCNLDTIELTKTAFLGNLKYFRETFSFAELAEWFTRLTDEYKKWADFQFAWQNLRQASIKKLEFPYAYRKGQKELASDVYRTIARRKNLFIQAPTGVGKTISTVFPAVKAVGEGLGDKIFYLTAKTITGTVAKEAFELLRTRGYQAKIIWLTAKEKLCLCEEMDCNPVHCPYAKGHYDRVNDAVYNLLQKEDVFTREVILEQAREYRVCPFEMSLDTATWADDIIGDYNYVFDPNVYLKRFFAEGTRGDYIFLVDEAHNLVERSREMYSASIYKEDFLAAKKLLKPYQEKHDRCAERVIRHLEKCNRILLGYKRECENYVVYENIGTLIFALTRLAADLDEYLQKSPDFPERREVNEFYLNLRNFMNIYELVDEHYVVYSEHEEDGRFKLKFYCVDPSLNLQERIDKGNATIFFSATLLPIQYYKSLLSTRRDNYAVYAQTAFSEEQRLLLFGNDVSSKYTRRGRAEYERIALYIEKTARAKQGNYMVFFPSYRMMQEVYDVFLEGGETDEMRPQEYFPEGAENAEIVEHPEEAEIAEHPEEAEIAEHPNDAENPGDAEPCLWCMMQQTGMREAEREAFLQAFSGEASKRRGGSLVAFCVLGGIFGEGIDLKKEQLIGAVIVGTGLPQISNEREILMRYYDERAGAGFDYAYRFPGMNKVLQAAGRVIRTTEDVGVIELLDERFLKSDYRGLFPREWEQRRICNVNEVEQMLAEFWERRQEF
ncbi:ATP-dependent DNA helicase [Roseburia hominis]|uniref:ATP-dependent DNA helicase n=1 Tax=Roseburia hominis TaxID=301301 RepID=UPI003520C412